MMSDEAAMMRLISADDTMGHSQNSREGKARSPTATSVTTIIAQHIRQNGPAWRTDGRINDDGRQH